MKISNFKFQIASLMIMLMIAFAAPALAGPKSGVWPVALMDDNTYMSGCTPNSIYGQSGISVFVIDLTAKNNYTGNIEMWITGLTTVCTGGGGRAAGTTGYPPGNETGVSIYYAEFPSNPLSGLTNDPTYQAASRFFLGPWTLVSTDTTVRGGVTNVGFDIPANPAAPYVGIKIVPTQPAVSSNGTSQFQFGLKYSTSGNPK